MSYFRPIQTCSELCQVCDQWEGVITTSVQSYLGIKQMHFQTSSRSIRISSRKLQFIFLRRFYQSCHDSITIKLRSHDSFFIDIHTYTYLSYYLTVLCNSLKIFKIQTRSDSNFIFYVKLETFFYLTFSTFSWQLSFRLSRPVWGRVRCPPAPPPQTGPPCRQSCSTKLETRLGVDRVKPWNSVRINLGLGLRGPNTRPGLSNRRS